MGGGSNACWDPHQGRSVSLVPTNGAHQWCELGKALGSSCHTSRKQQEYTRVQLKSSASRRTYGAPSAGKKHSEITPESNS